MNHACHPDKLECVECGQDWPCATEMLRMRDVEHEFEDVQHVELPPVGGPPHDFGIEAQKAAEHHLANCAERLDVEEQWGVDEAEGRAGMWDTEPCGPFCGCDTCVVREVLHAAWAIAEESVLDEIQRIADGAIEGSSGVVAFAGPVLTTVIKELRRRGFGRSGDAGGPLPGWQRPVGDGGSAPSSP